MEIKPAVIEIFGQLTYLLEKLSNDEYSKASEVLHDNSIGQHMRHTLEFFSSLMNDLPSGTVNYDKRERDIFLESNTLEALSTIASLRVQIEAVDEDLPLKLIRQHEDPNVEGNYEVPTNLHRELIYNVEHAVHHMALIKIGLKEIKPTLELPKNFGVASSTVKYRQSQQASV